VDSIAEYITALVSGDFALLVRCFNRSRRGDPHASELIAHLLQQTAGLARAYVCCVLRTTNCERSNQKEKKENQRTKTIEERKVMGT
jgi:hypothetical protein